jgi:hypothetical protein
MVVATNAAVTGMVLNNVSKLPELYAHYKCLPSIYPALTQSSQSYNQPTESES